MTNQERIDQYNERVALLTEYGLPVNETLNIDDVGNFNLVEEIFKKYKGRVVGDGVVFFSIYDNPQDAFPDEMMWGYNAHKIGTLRAYNIDEIDFVGSMGDTYFIKGSTGESTNNNELEKKMETVCESYKQIIDEIKKGTSDEEIAEKFGLESFKHEKSKKKSMQ